MSNKERFEIEKIKLEISELKRPLFKKLSTYSSLLPSILAAGSLCVLLFTSSLKAERDILAHDINKLSEDTTSLSKNIFSLNSTKDSLENKLEFSKKESQALTQRLFRKDSILSDSLNEKEKKIFQLQTQYQLLGLQLDKLNDSVKTRVKELQESEKVIGVLLKQREDLQTQSTINSEIYNEVKDTFSSTNQHTRYLNKLAETLLKQNATLKNENDSLRKKLKKR